MSFVTNDTTIQQLSFTDSFHFLTKREQRMLEKSWAKYFADEIFPKIDEKPYAVLYSPKDSRPNTPVNVQIGALIRPQCGQLKPRMLKIQRFWAYILDFFI